LTTQLSPGGQYSRNRWSASAGMGGQDRPEYTDTEIPQTRISQIIKGKRRITADTALRFSSYFGTTAKFWLGLQVDYDIEEERKDKMDILTKIKTNAPQHAVSPMRG